MDTEENGERQISAVSRTITVLEVLARHTAINLEQLAKETDLPKATLLRFLGTLASLGYVYRDPYDQYSLTLKMLSVGSRRLEHLDLPRIARPIAEELVEALGETVHMGIREENSAIYVLKVESLHAIRMHSRVGKTIPLYCTAIGKLLLAYLDESERNEIIDRLRFVACTANTLKTAQALQRELAGIRDVGWAMDLEEHETGVICLSAPIRDHTGRVIAAIGVSWPQFRYDENRRGDYVRIITDRTNQISSILGYLPS
jgi:IclR family KDG regulon transcriptional repressor